MKLVKGGDHMGLKAPGILTFMFSVILTVVVLIMKFFQAQIPFLNGNELWVLLVTPRTQPQQFGRSSRDQGGSRA